MKNIEQTIVELGSIFQQLAHMVKEQEEVVQRSVTRVAIHTWAYHISLSDVAFHTWAYHISLSPVCLHIYRQDLSDRYCFYSQAYFGVFCSAGATVPPIKVKFGREEWTVDSGWGLWLPKLKKLEFYQYIAPKGRVLCTIFTKFTGFMRVLSLHNFAKFGCFISINDKIITNLLQ